MSESTDGILCYGFLLGDEEGLELPWDGEEFNGDEEGWWAFGVHGDIFRPVAERPYNDEGYYNPGFADGDPRIQAYHDERAAHIKSVPKMPLDLVNTCSEEYPMWIAAVPDTLITASRGDPVVVSDSLGTPDVTELRKFLAIYLPDIELGDPTWLLGSYWG